MRPNDSIQVFSDNYLENISDAFKILYTEEQLSDVTIYCKEGSVQAHKLVLAANSPYFYKIFKENKKDHHVIILHGTTLEQLRNLMDILYNGIANVPTDNIDAITSLVNEFEIKSVVFGGTPSVNVKLENDQNSSDSAHNRDTRFKGQKRVAVDYLYDSSGISSQNAGAASNHQNSEIRLQKKPNMQVNFPTPSTSTSVKIELPASNSDNSNINSRKNEGEPPKLNAWARKQRKFKCTLCPSSFKRSSHLTRHQLVHTGERPYACNQCDKAFSRHDKLKHHIKKAHEFIPDSMYERIDADEMNLESDETDHSIMGQQTFMHSLKNDEVTNGNTSQQEYGPATSSSSNSFERENSPLFTISHITSILEDSFVSPPKKSRGRPRKYPPVTSSLEHNNALEFTETYQLAELIPDDMKNEDFECTNDTVDHFIQNDNNDNVPSFEEEGSPLFTISHIKSVRNCFKRSRKKRRGRPRKIGRVSKISSQSQKLLPNSELQSELIPIANGHTDGNYENSMENGLTKHCRRTQIEMMMAENKELMVTNLGRLRSESKLLAKYDEIGENVEQTKENPSSNVKIKRKMNTKSSTITETSSTNTQNSPLIVSIQQVKRGRGRPRINQVIFPPSMEVQNYNLPYDYMSNQDDERTSNEDAVMLEPLVEIKTDQNELQDEDGDKKMKNITRTTDNSNDVAQIVMEPIATKINNEEENEKKCSENGGNCEEVNIKEIETKIGLIGECTISVAN